MPPTKHGNYGVRAQCPACNAVVVWNDRDDRREFAAVIQNGRHAFQGRTYARVLWHLLQCSGCGRAGLAHYHDEGNAASAVLDSFYPAVLASARLPNGIPAGIVNEFREAELCATAGAWRAASAMLRSALEKTLKANGYTTGTLQAKIDAAASDGVITDARKQRAHDDVRVLGNEVVHDDWRLVQQEEVEAALHYVQRILEDLYDDRPSVLAALNMVGRNVDA
jgi:hypothetical protein